MEIMLSCIAVFSFFLYGVFVSLLFRKFTFSWKRILLYSFFIVLFYFYQNIYCVIGLSFLSVALMDGELSQSILLSVFMNTVQSIVKIFFLFLDSNFYETVYSTVTFHFDKFCFYMSSLSISVFLFLFFRKLIWKILNQYQHSSVFLFFLLWINTTYVFLWSKIFLSYLISVFLILGICSFFYLHERLLCFQKDTIISDRLNLDYRRKVHENRNHLLLIQSMDYKEDIHHYVDSLLGGLNKCSNHYWVQELSYLHLPGIKDFLNYKLDLLEDMGATIEVFVSDELDNIKEMNHNHYKDLSTIMGVVLDNMIDYMSEIDQKLISIHFYIEDNILHGEFGNNIEKEIDLDSIFISGYSTKGKRRGVGLAIVSDIVASNQYIECRPKIIDNFFLMDVAYDLHTKNH